MVAREINALTQPITELKGVGNKIAERLHKLGIKQIQDLLFHLPLRYQDRTQLLPMGSLISGKEGLVEGAIRLSQVTFGRRRTLLCYLDDDTGSIVLRFFHFSKVQQQQLSEGVRVRCFGEIRKGPSSLEMVHPEYSIIPTDTIVPVDAELTPIYPTTEGLHQLSFRKLIKQALIFLTDGVSLPELIPPTARLHDVADSSLAEALGFVHQPPPDVNVQLLMDRRHPKQRRLAYEELLAQHISLRKVRSKMQSHKAPILRTDGQQRNALLTALPFSLTTAQQRVINDILKDIKLGLPMQRLIQGDVGSGKTIVAALAVLESVTAGYQAAMMAPTELLAEQHFQTFKNWLSPLGIKVGWCVGKQTVVEKRRVMAELVQGEIDVLVGTHALFQDNVIFSRLGIVVIDEQHRFGVHQRLALRDKGRNANIFPHQLVMTATPIPRTLAMTAYADLDVSVIDELPPGRMAITTAVIPDTRRQNIIERVHIACQQSRQVYWVCTLVEESEKLQCKAAEDAATELQLSLPDCRVALIHGRMKSAEKDQIMMRFKSGEIDLLVATTVIEVGVDVPNASLMIIENAERLGLAQLHQLRGRVGRGKLESQCVLMYRSPLSENAQSRLSCLRDTNDGFLIAQRDLELRGPGELLGTRQTGLAEFRVANLMEDQDLINLMSAAADNLLTSSPDNSDALVERWFGHKIDFGQV